jgi:hypothetical protein
VNKSCGWNVKWGSVRPLDTFPNPSCNNRLL